MIDVLNFVWDYLVPFLFILTVLVFVHEMGHYLIARLNRVRVEVFSIGFGREIYGFTDRSGTRWKIGFLPLGGYVKFFGDASAASVNRKASAPIFSINSTGSTTLPFILAIF